MSKRQRESRIKDLFADLTEDLQTSQQSSAAWVDGWTWESDRSGSCTAISQGSFNFLGYPVEDWIGQPLSFGLDPQSAWRLEQALLADIYPVELTLQYRTQSGGGLMTEAQLYPIPWHPDDPFERETVQGWRAIIHPILKADINTPPSAIPLQKPVQLSQDNRRPKKKIEPAPGLEGAYPTGSNQEGLSHSASRGYQVENHHIQPSQEILTELGRQSLEVKRILSRPSGEDKPAVLVLSTPLAGGENNLLLELLDETPGRIWNDAERMLVEQVADQMSLALENARLFQQTQNALAATSALYEASSAFSAAQSYVDILVALRQHTLLVGADKILAIHYFNRPWKPEQPAEWSEILSGWSARVGELHSVRLRLDNNSLENGYLAPDRITIHMVLANDFPINEVQAYYQEGYEVTCLAFIPLVTGGQWLGFICAGYGAPIQYSSEDSHRLLALSSQAAVALNNLRLLAETRQRNLELAAINSVIAAASRSLALEEMLIEVLEQVLETVEYVAGMITLVDEAGILRMAIQSKMPAEYIAWLDKYSLEGSLSHLVFQQRLPLNVGDLDQNSPVDVSRLIRFGLHSYMGVPLELKGMILGTICVFGEQIQSAEQARLPLLQAIGQQVAVAVENARLFKETQKRGAELALINRVVASVAGSKDLQTSLGIIASELGRTLQVQTGIALLNEERQVMTVVASYSPIPDAPDVIGVDLAIQGNPSTQQVLATRKTLVIENPQESPLTAPIHEEIRLRSIQSLMLIPLIANNSVIGTVGLDILEKSRQFKPDEIRLAETIVLQASTVIQNTRLYQQTEHALAETEALYKASAEFNAAESYMDVLEILRRFTLIGRSDATNLLALFEEPQMIGYGPLTLPEWFLPIASWSAEISLPISSSRSRMADIPAANELIRSESPNIILDVDRDLRLDLQSRYIYAKEFHARSVLFAPLVAGGGWIGFLGTFFSQVETLTNPDIRHLMVLVSQASIAIQNIRLLGVSRRRAEQLQTAAEVARDTSSTLALDALLLRVVNLLCVRFGYNHASVFLLDEDGVYAVVREATGEAGAEMKRRPHMLGIGSQSVIGTVTRNGLPLVVNDVSQNPVHRPNPLLPDTRAELGIPLKIGQRVIGALDVQSNEVNAFTPDDVAVLQVLADQIAVAVDNARAYMLSQQAVEEMREVDRLKSQFLANMSHELRTPLNSIIGFSRVILKGIDGPLTDLQEQDLSAIYNSGQHLLNLINDVLDLSKIEAGKLELAFDENVNLADLINSVMSTVIGLVKDKPIKLTRDISTDLPTVRADPTKIRQVLINLFSNAAKFTEQGSIGIFAVTQPGPDGNQEVIIKVSDTGSGIALEHQAKLFQPFTQVDDSLTRKTSGTGLGLSICRHLVEMHGGRIGVESEVGVGSTFFFTIPVQLPGIQNPDNSDAKLILVIDDERPIVQLYERYLNHHGYRVIGLSESLDAVRRAHEVLPYAILLDVMMPGKDGWHVLQDLKSDPDTRAIPVIMCTILENQAKGESLGADGYLTKPILEEELVRTLATLEKQTHRYSVLGITDNDQEFERFQTVFRDEPDFQLGLAYGGHQAITAIQYRRPDVILLAIQPDISRPSTKTAGGLNATSLLETLRNDPKFMSIPVILLADLPRDSQDGERIRELASVILPKNRWGKESVLEAIQQFTHDTVPAS